MSLTWPLYRHFSLYSATTASPSGSIPLYLQNTLLHLPDFQYSEAKHCFIPRFHPYTPIHFTPVLVVFITLLSIAILPVNLLQQFCKRIKETVRSSTLALQARYAMQVQHFP